MLTYVWPKDRPDLRARVGISLGLLGGAKVSLPTVKIGFCFGTRTSSVCEGCCANEINLYKV